jgi:hypothetical protein
MAVWRNPDVAFLARRLVEKAGGVPISVFAVNALGLRMAAEPGTRAESVPSGWRTLRQLTEAAFSNQTYLKLEPDDVNPVDIVAATAESPKLIGAAVPVRLGTETLGAIGLIGIEADDAIALLRVALAD